MTEPAFLYVIGEADGPHKVGLSTKPKRRLSELQCGTPRPLILKKSSPTAVRDAGAVEAWAHHFMLAQRLRGEWFNVSAEEAWKHLHAAEMAVLCGRQTPGRMPSSGRVGRPPLKGELTSVRLTEGAKDRIAALVGTYGMAKFIREAVDAEIERRERQAASTARPSKPSLAEG